jgi:regulator of extracellular matrix RemA (YlzA/DUF370 family)
MKLLNVGNGHTIVAQHVFGIFSYNSRSLQQMKKTYDDRSMTINLSGGNGVKTLILTVQGQLILSSVSSDTISSRLKEIE